MDTKQALTIEQAHRLLEAFRGSHPDAAAELQKAASKQILWDETDCVPR